MGDTQTDVNEQTNNEKTENQKEPEAPKSPEDTLTEGTPQITNDAVETDPVRKVVNKKLSTMSKESKEGKNNKKRPLKPPKDEFKLTDINPMYLLTFIGLIIVGVSLYYTRKTVMKEEEAEEARERVEQKPETPSSKPKNSVQRKQGIKGPDHMDPLFAQRHKNTGIFTFDD